MAAMLLALLALPALAAALYLVTASALSSRPLGLPRPRARRATSFVIVVPAHNEAEGLPATLASLAALEWPADRRRVLVVADNCTDATAQVAAAHGAEVLLRHEQSRRGKGYALEAAFFHLLGMPTAAWDAVVVIDADTEVQPNLLAVAHARLGDGLRALQVPYLARGGAHPMHSITEVALYASHVVRGRAREALALSVGLRGNGMVLTRDALERVPYRAFSAIEDLEYGLALGRAGLRVGFAPGTVVRGDMPTEASVANVQRTRWIGGRAALLRRELPGVLRDAWRLRSRVLLDLALDLLIPPLAALTLLVALGVAVTAAMLAAGHADARLPLLLWGLAALGIAAHVAHAAVGAQRARALLRAARLLPAYVLRKTTITLRTLLVPTHHWVRTARPGEAR
jgi:cellulose synthase/poly-beta-1,6-N-acetylglucosamine synthase-like glycosyltransferase